MWTEEQVSRLRELTERSWTAAQIGADMGVTRNAVIGKWHRLDITPPNSNFWEGRPDRRKRLAKMWIGGYTAPQIAAELGVTRKAISSQLFKMRKKNIEVPHHKRGGNMRGPGTGKPRSPSWAATPSIVQPLFDPKRLLDLAFDQCRYPDEGIDKFNGDTPMFCGAQVVPDYPYCAAHCAVCYRLPGGDGEQLAEKYKHHSAA